MILEGKAKKVNVKIPKYVPKGSEAAFKLLQKELEKGKDAKIAVYGDPDIDGLFAGLIMESFLDSLGYGRKTNTNYRYFLNENRAHGFFMSDEDLRKLSGYLLIAVDFTITPRDFARLVCAGVNVIVLDHHEIKTSDYITNLDYVYSQKNDIYGVICNNQYASEPEEFRFLSGAGMVYYFIEYVSQQLDSIEVDADVPALVGITLLSDIRELETPRARAFLKYLFTSDSDYIKYLQWLVKSETKSYQRFSPFGVPKMTRNFIDFEFSPIINSLLRANMGYQAMDMLRNVPEVVQSMRASDFMWNIRRVQKSIISQIQEYSNEQEELPGSLCRKYSNMQVIVLPDTFKPNNNFAVTNFIGVACSRIKDEDKTGVIFVINSVTKEVIRGSVRGGMDGIDYLSIFKKIGIPCAGHHNAFGILKCNISNIDFDALNEAILNEENRVSEIKTNTRTVLPVSNLSVFMNSQARDMICTYNEYSRDNFRIYLKYIGKNEPTCTKISDNYKKYNVDGVMVNCFDSTLSFEDGFIQLGYTNGSYVGCVLRPSFDYPIEQGQVEVMRKLQTLKETF